MRSVSLSVSPFVELLDLGSEKPMIRPPSLLTAVSKLSRVRVEGSKKRVAATIPSIKCLFGFVSKRRARSKIRRISSSVHCSIDTICFIGDGTIIFDLLRKGTKKDISAASQ